MSAGACLLYLRPCHCWVTEGKELQALRKCFLVEKQVIFGSQNLSLPSSSLCNAWKEARPLHLALGELPPPRVSLVEPPGPVCCHGLLSRRFPPQSLPAAQCLKSSASPCKSSLLSWKHVFNIPMPSSAVQQSVGLICIIKPCCKELLWSKLVGEWKYRE